MPLRGEYREYIGSRAEGLGSKLLKRGVILDRGLFRGMLEGLLRGILGV